MLTSKKCQETLLQAFHLHKHTLSLIQYLPCSLPLSVCLSVSLAHPPTKLQSSIPSSVVWPSLIVRGQGRDVHPQLLVSQRQTQELRLDNQLRTSVLLSVMGMFTYTHAHLDGSGGIAWFVGLQFKVAEVSSASIQSEWCDSIQISRPPSVEVQRLTSSSPQVSAFRMDKKERMVRLEHRNEREGGEKERKRKGRGRKL